MGDRRMFSKRVVESTRFLRMPATSQNLYFHLGMSADDDGIAEAYPVMCTTGASEDDLRVLVSKKFVTVLNQDTVIYINDWLEHNTMRADRKKDSIYKDLLLEVVPDAKIIEPKQSYYSRQKEICQTNSGQNGDKGLTSDSLSKDKLSKDKLSKENIDYQKIANLYNEICISFPRVIKLSERRKKTIRARLKTYAIDDFKALFEKAEASDFLKGGGTNGWRADFDWLITDKYMPRVLEGVYDNKKTQEAQHKPYSEHPIEDFKRETQDDYEFYMKHWGGEKIV